MKWNSGGAVVEYKYLMIVFAFYLLAPLWLGEKGQDVELGFFLVVWSF